MTDTPTVLVVDDHDDARASLAWVLRAHGFDATEAGTAADALRLAREGHPDLVVLDVVLSDGSGLDVCRRLKADPATAAPVLLLSGLATAAAAQARGLECGADAYLTKPADPDVLVAQARALLRVRRAEAEARDARAVAERSLAQLRAVVETMADGLVVADPAGNLLDWNPAALRMHGYQSVEAVRRHLSEFADTFVLSPPDGPPLAPDDWPMARVLRGETLADFAVRLRRLDTGLERYVAFSGAPVFGPHGRVELGVLTIHDETGRRLAEAEARRTAALLRAVADGTTDAVYAKDRSGRYVLANPAMARFLGRPVGEILGRTDADLLDPDAARRVTDLDRRVMAAGAAETVEEAVTLGGVARTFLSTKAPYRDDAGGVAGVVGISHDITDRKRTEEEREKFVALVEHSADLISMATPDGRVFYFNPAGRRLLGLDEGVADPGGRIDDYVPADVAELYREVAIPRALAGGVWKGEARVRHAGTGRAIDVYQSVFAVRAPGTGAPLCLATVARDLTGQKELEERYRQAQKMEAVGRLAGGIAHDFNNLLTIITGYSELLLDVLPPADPARAFAAEMQRAGERAAGLTRQLLAFSRRQLLRPRVLDLNAVVADTARLLKRLLGEDVALATVLQPGLWPVKADPGQVEQVLMNLAVNARDAMPTGGKLTVETANVELGEEYARSHPEAAAGPHVLLAVTDTGAGMTDEVKARAFEPFFTTKELGKGTGLGLATVHGIVRQSGGHVALYSEVGHGTSVKVYLPRAEAGGGPGPVRAAVRAAPRGTETVLVAEDEDAVRSLTRHVLEQAGYAVLEAEGGEEAARLAAGYSGTIHLLVTDVVMPGGSGRALAEQLVAERPGLRVLYLSGYTDDAVVRHGVLGESVHFLQKPFTPAVLAAKVRDVLDAPPGPAAPGSAE